jgi:hypothetical protein
LSHKPRALSPQPFQFVLNRLAFDELEHEIPRDADLHEIVDARDVGMVERGKGFGFNLKARQARRVCSKFIRQRLDRDVALEPRITRPEHAAHPALAEERGDLVRAEPCSDVDRHQALRLYGQDGQDGREGRNAGRQGRTERAMGFQE